MIEWCPPATLGGSNPAVNLSVDSPSSSLMPGPLSVHAFRFVRGSRPPIGSRVDRGGSRTNRAAGNPSGNLDRLPLLRRVGRGWMVALPSPFRPGLTRRCRLCRPLDGTDTGAGWARHHPAPPVGP